MAEAHILSDTLADQARLAARNRSQARINLLLSLTLLGLLILLWTALALSTPRFLTQINVTNLMRQAYLVAILAVGQTFVIITAGIDLALALVEADCGRAHALAVARHLVMFLKRPGGQAQFSTTLALQQGDERFDLLHAWIADNLATPLSVAVLAAQTGMSERSFLRHYRRATGVTPAQAVERLRVEAARQALAETRLPIKRIASRCGFGSEETMRRSFQRVLATGPQDYRARFAR